MKQITIKEFYDMHLIPDTQRVELWGWEICWDETDEVEYEDCATLVSEKWRDIAHSPNFSNMCIAEGGITTNEYSKLIQIEVF